jgi:hypothetical protein
MLPFKWQSCLQGQNTPIGGRDDKVSQCTPVDDAASLSDLLSTGIHGDVNGFALCLIANKGLGRYPNLPFPFWPSDRQLGSNPIVDVLNPLGSREG